MNTTNHQQLNQFAQIHTLTCSVGGLPDVKDSAGTIAFLLT